MDIHTRNPMKWQGSEGMTRQQTVSEQSHERPFPALPGGIHASKSESYLPSLVCPASQDESPSTRSPFTSIPEAFFRRRTGIAWLSRSKSVSASHLEESTREIPHEASFEVQNLGDIKAFDSGWLDDDVEEVMVVSKRAKKGRPLSDIVEASEGFARHSFKNSQKMNKSINANHFEYIRNLGVDGSSGSETVLARQFDNERIYTVKLFRKSAQDADRFRTRFRDEEAALKLLARHGVPFITRLWWSFEDERAMYLVVDRTDIRNLRQVVERNGHLAKREALLCAAELVTGIFALHENGIVHANLSPDCILLGEDGHVVISDFGQARFLHSDATEHIIMQDVLHPKDAIFHAPELLLGWDHDYAVDWWSFGLLLVWILTGAHPFIDGKDAAHWSIVRSKILHARPHHGCMEEDAHQLVTRCLQRNPALRIDGPGVKKHDYFQEIKWDDIVSKRIEAPFALNPDVDQGNMTNTDDCPSQLPASHFAKEHPDPFSFSRRHDPSCDDSVLIAGPGRPRRSLQPLSAGQNSQPDDEILMPILDAASVSGVADILEPTLEEVPLARADMASTGVLGEADVSILPELDSTLDIGLPTPPTSRIGNLRKYSSLNFDELDSLASSSSSKAVVGSFSRQLGHSESTALLRKSKSILGISLDSFRDMDDTSSFKSGRWTNKLRKRRNQGTPIPPPPPVPTPVLELPRGVEKIGSGIGYTYRGTSRRPVLNLASLTPRTCHGIFTGRRSRSDTKRNDEPRSGVQEVGVDREHGENEEDLMDEVMREIYGDEWNAGVSPDPEVREDGVAWGDAPSLTRFGMALDASFAGPDSTLRLVTATAPSTPRLGP